MNCQKVQTVKTAGPSFWGRYVIVHEARCIQSVCAERTCNYKIAWFDKWNKLLTALLSALDLQPVFSRVTREE